MANTAKKLQSTTLGYLINVQQTLLFFEKNFQIQNFQIFILACFAFYSQ